MRTIVTKPVEFFHPDPTSKLNQAAPRNENMASSHCDVCATPTWAELEAHRAGLVRLLTFGMHLAPEDAEDVASDVLLKAKVRTDIEKLQEWLDRAAFVRAVDQIRKRQRREKHTKRIYWSREREAMSAYAEAERRDLIELVQRGVEALPQRLRYLWMRRHEGATVAELAAMLGVSRERIRQLLWRAHQKLCEYVRARLWPFIGTSAELPI